MSPNTSSVFIPGVSYVVSHPVPLDKKPPLGNRKSATTASSAAPNTTTTTSGGHLPQSHFENHLQNIRKFHQDLQDRIKYRHPELASSAAADGGRRHEEEGGGGTAGGSRLAFPEPSSGSGVTTSFLVKNLRYFFV